MQLDGCIKIMFSFRNFVMGETRAPQWLFSA
jgi:hypothetical protein